MCSNQERCLPLKSMQRAGFLARWLECSSVLSDATGGQKSCEWRRHPAPSLNLHGHWLRRDLWLSEKMYFFVSRAWRHFFPTLKKCVFEDSQSLRYTLKQRCECEARHWERERAEVERDRCMPSKNKGKSVCSLAHLSTWSIFHQFGF